MTSFYLPNRLILMRSCWSDAYFLAPAYWYVAHIGALPVPTAALKKTTATLPLQAKRCLSI